MSYYRICPICGANLDPGESCDCRAKEGAPAGAANTGEGGAEQIDKAVSVSYDTREREGLQA